jgi:AcrR family transcriptional regulator
MSSDDDRQQRTSDGLPRVRSGVCFEPPEPLPRGRHDLPREQILTAQAERLMIAVTELLAALGFVGVGIREITARAGVSRGAFYECFPSKEVCAFAAYRRWVEVLLRRFADLPTQGVTLEQLIEALLNAYLGLMEDDPVCARAFLVEFDGLGREAREQRRIALRRIAEYIGVAQTQLERRDGGLVLRRPLIAYVGIIYACRQTAVDMLDDEPEPNLRAVVPELAEWAAASLRVK